MKILDMGLALLDDAHSPAGGELTASGQMMGTLDYMAPEQTGDSHEVDIRADIYSLGATLYKLLGGHSPFSGEKYDTPVKRMMALATESVPPIKQRCTDIPDPLAEVIHRMLAKAPEERFATPAEIVTALEPFAADYDLAQLLTEVQQSARSANGVGKSMAATDEYCSMPPRRSDPRVSLRVTPAVKPRVSVPAVPISPTQAIQIANQRRYCRHVRLPEREECNSDQPRPRSRERKLVWTSVLVTRILCEHCGVG